MSRKKIAAGRTDGGGRKLAGQAVFLPQYTPKRPKRQHRDLSNLLDQALSRVEHHELQADYHIAQAAQHRAILRSLQALIPGGIS